MYVLSLYIVLKGKKTIFFQFLIRNWTKFYFSLFGNFNYFMKFIFLGNKMPKELSEHLRSFKCLAQGGNTFQRQEKERVLYLAFRGLDLRPNSANHQVCDPEWCTLPFRDSLFILSLKWGIMMLSYHPELVLGGSLETTDIKCSVPYIRKLDK